MARYNKELLIEDLSLHNVFAEVPKSQVTSVVNYLFDIIQERVVAGDDVAIAGFGKFEKYQKQDGTYKPKFTAFKDFKDAVTE